MLNFATELIESIGIVGAGIFIAIESIVIPLPSELVLLLSGFNVSNGTFSFLSVWIATTLGSLSGAYFLYGIGFAVSREGIERLVNRFGKFVGIKQNDVDSAFRWFERYGTFVIFFGRLIPLIRSLVSIPAGLAKMNLARFSLLTAAGSGIWNALWISIGVQLGDRWREAVGWAKYLDYAVYAIVLLIAVLLLSKLIKRRGTSAN